MCLNMEVGFGHLCLFRKVDGMKYVGSVHEQVAIPDPYGGIHPDTGIGIIHFSYFAENRLRRKSIHYASVPGSGFVNSNDLASRLDSKPVPLPNNVRYLASLDWLEHIRMAE